MRREATDPPPRRAVTTRPRGGPGLAFLGAAASLSAFFVGSAALSTTTLRDPSWWVVIA